MRVSTTPEELEVLYQRVLAGEIVPRIAAELGVQPSSVYRLLKRRYGFVPTAVWASTLCLPDDPAVVGYIAGIVDGEGSIRPRRGDNRWMVHVGMTDEGVIRWLGQFGGYVSVHQRRAPFRTVYKWHVQRARDVLALLQSIHPYIIVKRDVLTIACQELEERLCQRHV